ncbi:MAG: hypothetical protein ACR2M1_12530 [Gemmatimonadaceae bacterium]
MLLENIARWRNQLMQTLQGWSSEERTVRGFSVRVVNSRPDIDTDAVFGRMDAALGLIATYQPRAFRRMQHDFERILVQRFPCRAAYFPDSRTCLTELTFSVNPEFTAAQVASSIVHEGVHARVRQMCTTYEPDRLPREERLCRKAELDFGLAVPGGEPVVIRALQSLALGDEDVAPAIDWTEAQRRVAGADAADAAGNG